MKDLSCLGRYEAGYVLKEARIVLEKAAGLQAFVTENELTPEYLYKHLNDPKVSLADKGNTYIAIHTYQEIYETLANRLNRSLDFQFGSFPVLKRWLCGGDPQREWRNKCAHNAGVPPTYSYNEYDRLFFRRFDTKGFLEQAIPALSPLIADLTDFVGQLEQNINTFPILDNRPALDHPDWADVVRELVELEHPEILQLEAIGDQLIKFVDDSSALCDKIESGDFDLRQSEAKELSTAQRNTIRLGDEIFNMVSRRRLAVAEKWWREKNAAEMLQNRWDDETAAAWPVPDAAAEAEAEAESGETEEDSTDPWETDEDSSGAGETDADSTEDQADNITPASEPGDTEKHDLDLANDSRGNVETPRGGEADRDEPFTASVGDSRSW